MTTVPDHFAAILVAAGVKRIYGIVGGSMNGLTNAIPSQGIIEWVHGRHEEVAAIAASAEAHLTVTLKGCAGARGIRLEDPSEVEAGVAAVGNRIELAMPPTVIAERANGFTRYMVKAVMSARIDTLIDLARTDLWH
jgi:Thiamine pyrophosphate enzyme, N-terminal TPP binding domain